VSPLPGHDGRSLEGETHPDSDILQHLGVDASQFGMLLLPERQVVDLVVSGRRLAPDFVGVLRSWRRLFVETATRFEALPQSCLLGRCGKSRNL